MATASFWATKDKRCSFSNTLILSVFVHFKRSGRPKIFRICSTWSFEKRVGHGFSTSSFFFRKQFLVWEMFFLPLFPSFTENQVMDCYRAQINLREKGGGGGASTKGFSLSFFGRYATFPILAFYSLTQKVKKGNFFHTFAGDKVGGRGKKTIYDNGAGSGGSERARMSTDHFARLGMGFTQIQLLLAKKCSFFQKSVSVHRKLGFFLVNPVSFFSSLDRGTGTVMCGKRGASISRIIFHLPSSFLPFSGSYSPFTPWDAVCCFGEKEEGRDPCIFPMEGGSGDRNNRVTRHSIYRKSMQRYSASHIGCLPQF